MLTPALTPITEPNSSLSLLPMAASLHPIKILNVLSLLRLRRSISSSQTRQTDPLVHKTFFRSSNRDGLINRLCGEKNFKEAIDMLCEQKRLTEAVQLLYQIDRPSPTIYSTLLQHCLQQRALKEGKLVHSHIKASNFMPGIFISNRLLDMYCKCNSLVDAQNVYDKMDEKDLCSFNIMITGYAKAGHIDKARQLFDKMPERDNFSWTAIVSAHVHHNRPKEALNLYRMMQKSDSSESNKFTISSVLAASASIPSLRIGKEIHSHIMRNGLDSDSVIWSALSDVYAKCGSLKEARHVFDRTLDKDVVSWTGMINRYFEDGKKEEGFALFSDLLKTTTIPNEFTFSCLLNAVADQVAEELGKQIHGFMIRVGFDPVSFAASALVHMYSKCGNVKNAKNVFSMMPKPDLVSWTSLISGYAQNGQSNEALKYFELLLKSGTKPDHITYVGVLCACTHAGLVDEGLKYFRLIKEKHGITHTSDHYACLVDLLSRSARFKEVENIIDNMPIKPDKFVWASLLGGCRIHGNIELAKRAGKALFEIEPENPATYITLCNIYANAGLWDEVAKIRQIMGERGVVKKPGLSWIEINRKVHLFLVEDKSHPKSAEIYKFLENIFEKMKEEGYVPDTNFVLHDVEAEQKEQHLTFHSEKLAVAFGIISTPEGTKIKVFKNLRTCVDCHNAIKFISKIFKREIIMRDSNRFHCFKDGSCSCGDFW